MIHNLDVNIQINTTWGSGARLAVDCLQAGWRLPPATRLEAAPSPLAGGWLQPPGESWPKKKKSGEIMEIGCFPLFFQARLFKKYEKR